MLTPAELNTMTQVVAGMLSTETTDVRKVRGMVETLAGEGVTLELLVKFLIRRKHERENQGLSSPTPTMGDINELVLRLTRPTANNLQRWKERASQVPCLCPRCGFTGSQKPYQSSGRESWDLTFTQIGDLLACPSCCVLLYHKYFTGKWADGEQQVYEADAAKRTKQKDDDDFLRKAKIETAEHIKQMVELVTDEISRRLPADFPYCEEREDLKPYVRELVRRTNFSVERIVARWVDCHLWVSKVPMIDDTHLFVANYLVQEGTMDLIEEVSQIDTLVEPEPLREGERRFFFTWDEFVLEFTTNARMWDDLLKTHDMSTGLTPKQRVCVTLHAKGYAEEHPCPCEDCRKRNTMSEPQPPAEQAGRVTCLTK